MHVFVQTDTRDHYVPCTTRTVHYKKHAVWSILNNQNCKELLNEQPRVQLSLSFDDDFDWVILKTTKL